MGMPRINPSIILAVGIAVVTVLYILSGQFPEDADVQTASAPGSVKEEIKPNPKVRYLESHVQQKQIELILRGRTEASRKVEIRAETNGKVIEILLEKGQAVDKGALLLKLDQEDRPIQLQKTRALVSQRSKEARAAQKLSKRGFQSEVKLAESLAHLADSRAQKAKIEKEIADTSIQSPFSGILEDLPVEMGDYVVSGDKVATILDLDPLLIVADLTQRDISKVKAGMSGRAELVDGQKAVGSVRYVAASGESATRTFRVELSVPNAQKTLKDAMSAEMIIPLEAVKAHRITPAILALSDSGEIGVKIIVNGNSVRFVKVEILANEPGGLWVGGLPDTARIITVGQEFVNEGQIVEPVLDQRNAELPKETKKNWL